MQEKKAFLCIVIENMIYAYIYSIYIYFLYFNTVLRVSVSQHYPLSYFVKTPAFCVCWSLFERCSFCECLYMFWTMLSQRNFMFSLLMQSMRWMHFMPGSLLLNWLLHIIVSAILTAVEAINEITRVCGFMTNMLCSFLSFFLLSSRQLFRSWTSGKRCSSIWPTLPRSLQLWRDCCHPL